MFKHMLVATDGSKLSEEAVAYAISIAAPVNARVTAIYVVQPVHTIVPTPVSDVISEDFANRIEEQSLKGTVTSLKDGVVRARLEGTLKMKHAFYPRKEDKNMVEATLLGYVEFQQDRTRIRALRLVTDTATYGGARQHFGAALRLVPARAV